MAEQPHKVIYLPMALSDLQQIVDYIACELKAPQAAKNFINKFDDAVSRLELFPLSGSSYKGSKMLEYDYRMLVVENYLVFYTLLGNTLEIYRVLYRRRKFDELV